MLRRRGARLADERSEGERSGAKRRGRGLGRRNIKNSNKHIKKDLIVFLFLLSLTKLKLSFYGKREKSRFYEIV